MSTFQMATGFNGVPDELVGSDTADSDDKERASPDSPARLKTYAENKKIQKKMCNDRRRVLFKKAEEPSAKQYMPRKLEQLVKMTAAEVLSATLWYPNKTGLALRLAEYHEREGKGFKTSGRGGTGLSLRNDRERLNASCATTGDDGIDGHCSFKASLYS